MRGRNKNPIPRMQRTSLAQAMDMDSAHGGAMMDPENPKLDIPKLDITSETVPHPKLSADQQAKAEQEHVELALRAKLHGGRI